MYLPPLSLLLSKRYPPQHVEWLGPKLAREGSRRVISHLPRVQRFGFLDQLSSQNRHIRWYNVLNVQRHKHLQWQLRSLKFDIVQTFLWNTCRLSSFKCVLGCFSTCLGYVLCHTICRKVLAVRLRFNRKTLCQIQLQEIAAPYNMRQDLEWLVMCVATTCAVFSTCLGYVLCHTICRKVRAKTHKKSKSSSSRHIICDYNRRRSICKECNGGSVCSHGKQRIWCGDCGGKAR